MTHKKIKTKIRKAQITDAALEAIAREGFSGLTIASIAKKVGIANSNVYRHFTGKEAVIDAIVTEIENNLKEIASQSSSQDDSPAKCLETIFFKHIEFFEKHKGIPRIIFSDEMYSGNEKIIMRLRSIMKQYVGQIKKVLNKGVADKEFDPGLDTNAAAMAFLGLIQSTALQWILFRYDFSPKKRGKKIWRIYLRGILLR